MLKIIRRRTYANIEEVTETKDFLKRLREKEMQIDALTRGVTDKMSVLDENNYRLEEEEVISIWASFARKMEIEEEREDC